MKRIALMLILPLAQAGAQVSGSSPELQALQEKYRLLAADAEAAVQTQRREALQQLQQRRAAAGSYDGAARAAALLNAKSAESAPVSDGRVPIVLQPTDAELTGSALSENGGIRLNRESAAASWKTSRAVPGWYEVVISAGVLTGSGNQTSQDGVSYDRKIEDDAAVKKERERMARRAVENSYTKEGGGIVRFEQISGIDAAAPLRWFLSSTGGWYVTKDTSLGKIQVRSALATFRLSAELAAQNGLAQVAGVRLVPCAAPEAAPAGAGAAGPVGDFERLKETYTRQAQEKTAAIRAAWVKTLAKLEADASLRNDAATVARVRAERARLSGAPVNPVLKAVDPLICKIRGEARVSNDRTLLTRMRPAAVCQVVWNPAVAGVPPGKWKVTVHAMVGKDHGGTFEISTGATSRNVKVTTKNKPRGRGDRKPRPQSGDGSSDSYEPEVTPALEQIDAGTIEIGVKDSITLKVVSLVHEDGGLFDLKHIELQPVTESQ